MKSAKQLNISESERNTLLRIVSVLHHHKIDNFCMEKWIHGIGGISDKISKKSFNSGSDELYELLFPKSIARFLLPFTVQCHANKAIYNFLHKGKPEWLDALQNPNLPPEFIESLPPVDIKTLRL